jgi:formamidopyrimidine-DNA glycosylase
MEARSQRTIFQNPRSLFVASRGSLPSMPELPDVVVYAERLSERFAGRRLQNVRIVSPFLLRTVEPGVSAFVGRKLLAVSRLGKRLVFDFGDSLSIVIHLMVAGRFRVADAEKKNTGSKKVKLPGKIGLAAFDFENAGSLILTEASTKKRASMHLVRGSLEAFDRGGVEPLDVDRQTFEIALRRERHTLKRSLTDPRLFSGIGNAYSDEILHAARLSPFRMSDALSSEEFDRLHAETQRVLRHWLEMFRAVPGFPEKVTAFRPEMAVHGKYGQPCPVCQSPVQRIRYADNECNYCARCQTAGKLLMDRGLSKLLKDDWPRTLEELEDKKAKNRIDDAIRSTSARK